ncbi:MAG: DUF3298 and DUF4163 domain-containing protein [Bacteroidota bacterium]
MKKIVAIICLAFIALNCNEEVKIDFEETAIETEKNAKISIVIPKATGTVSVAKIINETLEHYIANLNTTDTISASESSLENTVEKFDDDYLSFIKDFPEGSGKWEFFVDGEITYKTPELITIAINSYSFTGGAHGNTIIRLFNFDAQTGKALSKEDLISDLKTFSKIAEQYFEEKTAPKNELGTMQDYFYGEDFQWPETMGFNEEGVILLYNTYEIASYAEGITEFTIPYSDAESTLNFR